MTVHIGMPMRDYLALPAFNATLARALIQECPAAAHYASFLNPDAPRFSDDAMDAGSIGHEILLLGSEDCVEVIDPVKYPNKGNKQPPAGWGNTDICAARDAARARGKCPVLPGALGEIRGMVDSARAYLDAVKPARPDIWAAFQPGGGLSEVGVTWSEGATACKLRSDRIANDSRLIVDAKFTSRSAHPDAWGRTQLFGMGYHLSAAFYRRGIRAEYGIDDAEYVFLVVETEPPYLCSLVGLDPAALALGNEQVGAALELWERCIGENRWPGYPARVCYPTMPPWEDMRWQEQRERERAAVPYDSARKLYGEPKAGSR